MTEGFGARLSTAIAARGPLCVGIDPHPELLRAWDLPVSADGLARFMQAYARLARLPQPIRSPSAIPALVHRVVALEQRLPVVVTGGPNLTLDCDGAQIEQVLINLTKNAVEAVVERIVSTVLAPRVTPSQDTIDDQGAANQNTWAA